MFGRVRGCSLNSLQVLEMERTTPTNNNHNNKLLKHDSLSVYEKTLLKLQLGSQRDASLVPDESTNSESSSFSFNEPSLPVSAPDCASTDLFPSAGNCESMIISKEKPNGNLSILYMFSRYKTSKNVNKSSCDDNTLAMEDDCSSAGPHHMDV
uniref:uncharacterized protein LOC122589337 n=1 Tax=Erigeron canadensis TaxID=72917 RepID=UPI001CB99E5C|nr:uncharacterized protein LOC122589337 [Erigeron canadensis]